MQGVHLRKYGVQATIDFELYEVDGVDLRVDAASATGDINLVRDGAVEEELDADAFVDEGRSYSLVLSAAEMNAARIIVYVIDQSGTKVWLDKVLIVETYGNASAQHAFDLDTASVAQSANNETRLATIEADTNEIQGKLPANKFMGSSDGADDDGTLSTIATGVAAVLVDTAAMDTGAELLGLLASVDTTATGATHATTYVTLTAGKASNDAYNGMMISVTDADDNNTETRRIEDWTSGRKATFDRAMSFTPVSGDVVRIWTVPYDKMAAVAGGSANTYIVNDTGAGGGTGIADVHVWLTADSAGARIVASGVTDSNGEVIFYLDAGTTYYVWMAKSGYTFSDTGEAWTAT